MEQEAGLYDEAIATLRDGTDSRRPRNTTRARSFVSSASSAGGGPSGTRSSSSGRGRGALEGEIRGVTEIFRESKKRERLVALLDSMSAAGSDRGGIFARSRRSSSSTRSATKRRGSICSARSAGVPRGPAVSALVPPGKMPLARETDAFDSLRDDLMQRFLERFGSSAFAPHVRLMAAESKRESARTPPGPGGRSCSGRRSLWCDAAKRSGIGARRISTRPRSFSRHGCISKTCASPGEALAELSNVGIRNFAQRLETEELRGRILLASGDWAEAAAALGRLAADADTSVAFLGRYGLGGSRFSPANTRSR